ncbi:gamma-glutamylcyclotransferase 2-3-like [Cajanus cajan]|uniref:gamma-glutamylcyclotransferase 2-3-like n=1 Tax=Cajanus cajan TaxID=3821 RepID=UPI0010FB2813|nr:gamma-glutamylcyclotransferase 2-3-like [Cajanus cajan]
MACEGGQHSLPAGTTMLERFKVMDHEMENCMTTLRSFIKYQYFRLIYSSVITSQHLEVREKQYDKREYLDFYTDPNATSPAVTGVLVYIATSDKKSNVNYLGPASVEEIARQIVEAKGPAGPNRDYLFILEKALLQIGCKDQHVIDLANEVRRILAEEH